MGERLKDKLMRYEADRFMTRIETHITDAQKINVRGISSLSYRQAWKQAERNTPDSYVNSGLPKLSSFIKK